MMMSFESHWQVLPIQDMLRRAWNTNNFVSASTPSSNADKSKKRTPFLLEESSRPTVANISELMSSDYAWSCISLIAHIAKESDRLGIWAESCPCPQHAWAGSAAPKRARKRRVKMMPPGAADCCLKCCRAPELATGQAMNMQASFLKKRFYEFTESISQTTPQKRVELLGTFGKAMGRLWGSFDARLSSSWARLMWSVGVFYGWWMWFHDGR